MPKKTTAELLEEYQSFPGSPLFNDVLAQHRENQKLARESIDQMNLDDMLTFNNYMTLRDNLHKQLNKSLEREEQEPSELALSYKSTEIRAAEQGLHQFLKSSIEEQGSSFMSQSLASQHSEHSQKQTPNTDSVLAAFEGLSGSISLDSQDTPSSLSHFASKEGLRRALDALNASTSVVAPESFDKVLEQTASASTTSRTMLTFSSYNQSGSAGQTSDRSLEEGATPRKKRRGCCTIS